MRTILHIDFNSYFATVEQQANPRLRGKPIGVTGGDRMERTVVGAASIEAKKFGVKTGMTIGEARKLCPNLILVRGDSDKYLECTKRFLNILKDYSPYLEVFSIDEVFLELPNNPMSFWGASATPESKKGRPWTSQDDNYPPVILSEAKNLLQMQVIQTAQTIKQRIKAEVGEWIRCSIGISYNKVIAKLAGSLYKPDGLVIIADEEAAMRVLDQVELDEICGIGGRIKQRLNNMGIFSFKDLRKTPLEALLASFKSYGQFLFDISRGINHSLVNPFYEKEEVKSIGHRHTIDHDTDFKLEIKQLFLKLTELVARRLRAKKLVGKTITVWYRAAFNQEYFLQTGSKFFRDGMQKTTSFTNDGLEIFKVAWEIFFKLWQKEKIRMVGVSISNLAPQLPSTLTFLEDELRKQKIINTLDKINDAFGEFTLKRAILLHSGHIIRRANPFLADRRFKI